jgi:hypothetical protein
MEFFLPGLLFFILTVFLTFTFAPKVTPMIAAVLAIVFLMLGIYDHQDRFGAEYRLSTWHSELKIYGPFIMMGAIILYTIYGMVAFFSGGNVPVPSLPNVSTTDISNAVGNLSTSITESVNSAANTLYNNAANISNNVNANLFGYNNNGSAKKNNKNNFSKSFIEAL